MYNTARCSSWHMSEAFEIMNKELWHEDDERNIRYYSDLIETYGIDTRSLDWGSRESQAIRFSVLARVGKLDGASVLDVGCGMGDFYGWLKQERIEVNYTGIDITPGMIEIAQQRFPDACFKVVNLLKADDTLIKQYDYIVASGIFCHRLNEPFDFLKEMVKEMFHRCNKAVAFNSLSGWAPEKESGEFHADPLETVAWCRTLTPRVVLRHDYHPHDFTIYIYKKQNA